MELEGPAALEVGDRCGEAIVTLGRVWLEKDRGKTRFWDVMRMD